MGNKGLIGVVVFAVLASLLIPYKFITHPIVILFRNHKGYSRCKSIASTSGWSTTVAHYSGCYERRD